MVKRKIHTTIKDLEGKRNIHLIIVSSIHLTVEMIKKSWNFIMVDKSEDLISDNMHLILSTPNLRKELNDKLLSKGGEATHKELEDHEIALEDGTNIILSK